MDKKIKKKLGDFIRDEKGNISKGKILKAGMSVAAILASLGPASEIYAQHTSTNPTNHTSHVSHGSAVSPGQECVDQDTESLSQTWPHTHSHSSSHSSY